MKRSKLKSAFTSYILQHIHRKIRNTIIVPSVLAHSNNNSHPPQVFSEIAATIKKCL